jgi:hypothetical protein
MKTTIIGRVCFECGTARGWWVNCEELLGKERESGALPELQGVLIAALG